MVDANASREWEDGVKKELYEVGLWWKKGGICEIELSYISKLWCYVSCVQTIGDECHSMDLLSFNLKHVFHCTMNFKKRVRGLVSIIKD